MSLFLLLTIVQLLVAAALVGVILMQRSEGGGLGIGGSPSGMMSARGAADFLTRATKWLAVAFVVLSIILAAVAVETTSGDSIEIDFGSYGNTGEHRSVGPSDASRCRWRHRSRRSLRAGH